MAAKSCIAIASVRQQPTLSRQAAAISRQLSSGADDGDRKSRFRPDWSRWRGPRRAARSVCRDVRRVRHTCTSAPAVSPSVRPRPIAETACRRSPNGSIAALEVPGEIGFESFRNGPRRFPGRSCIARVEAKQLKHPLLVVREIERSQNACLVEDQQDRADRRGYPIDVESVRRHAAILRRWSAPPLRAAVARIGAPRTAPIDFRDVVHREAGSSSVGSASR